MNHEKKIFKWKIFFFLLILSILKEYFWAFEGEEFITKSRRILDLVPISGILRALAG